MTIDEFGRPEPLQVANEVTSVLGFLDFQRATLAWKCAGLDTTGMTAKVGASSMTLGGLLKHMTFVGMPTCFASRWTGKLGSNSQGDEH